LKKKQYGWFWECPNGGEKCIYRHALPPGFVLKKKEPEEEKEVIPVEQTIEAERKTLLGCTPVSLERFLKWKEDKRKKKDQDRIDAEIKRKQDIKTGKTVMSGREMFVFNPDLFVDDEEALDESGYEIQEEAIDPNVPHNVITVTETSITLTRKTANGESNFDDNQTEDENIDLQKEKDEDEEDEDDQQQNEDAEELPSYINAKLFLDDDDLPDDLDDD